MKINYFKIVSISVFALVLLNGCNSFLDTKTDSNSTMEAIQTNRSNLWAFGAAMYAQIHSGFQVLDGNFFAAASDEAQRTQNSGYTYTFNQGIISPDNVDAATNYMYNNCYEGIRAANYFLDFAKNGERLLALNRDTIRDSINFAKDKRNLNWFRAEAHICRAYYYMELIKRFGGVPIVETTLDNPANPATIPQSSYDDVVEYIVNEIDNNKANLQTSWRTNPDGVSTQDGRFEVKSALAIKARVLLYAASPLNNPTNDLSKWQRAAQAAQNVITLMNYTMPNNRNYGNYFLGNTATTNAESIFLTRAGYGNYLQMNNYPIATPGGHSGVTPTQNLVAAYEYIGTPNPANPYASRDPRLAATVVTNGSTWNSRVIDESPGGTDDMRKANASKTGYYLKKYIRDNVNLTQGGQDYNVWTVFRYAEILLMYAEAMNEAYGPDAKPTGFTMTARQALTQVRNSASTSLPAVTTTDVTEFRKAVKHECQVEFAFEDHRYWDLLRWKDAETVLNTPVQGVIVTKDANGKYVYQPNNNAGERVFQARNYHLPFSRSEVVNSSGTLTQNAGY